SSSSVSQPEAAGRWQALYRVVGPVWLPFLLSRAWVLALALALQWSLDSGAVRKFDYVGAAPLATLSATFDGNWYADVAAHGYSASADTSQEQNYAFFPLYSFIMRTVGSEIGLSAWIGGY